MKGGILMKQITNSTLVPISFMVIVFLAALWLTDVRCVTELNAKEIVAVKIKYDKVDNKLNEISDRLSRIEGRLEYMNKNLKEKGIYDNSSK